MTCPGSIEVITVDDGKVNVLSLAMLAEPERGARSRRTPTRPSSCTRARGHVLGGLRPGHAPEPAAPTRSNMFRAGFELPARLLSFPTPVLIACTGPHGRDGGLRAPVGRLPLGTSEPYRVTANEVAIGLTMPPGRDRIRRQRLTPAHLHRAVMLAEVFPPETAVTGGFLDRLVSPD